MAQLVVRQLDDDVKAALQRRARQNGRSMEEEVRDILRDALHAERDASLRLGSAIARRFRGIMDAQFPELRGHPVRGSDLDGPE